MPRVVLEAVSKSFAGADGLAVRAVDRLTLEIKSRELLALLGPSGCGKTTTLRLVAGLERADAGRILFDDQPVITQPPADRNVAMVFQSHALLPHLTVFENLAFGLKLRHVARSEIYTRVRATAELLGVAPLLDRTPGQLSGGERQRVALGRALVRQPKILLLDEPLSHLDEPLRVQLRSELLALHARLDVTMVYVTHDQAEALAVGDQVAILREGKLQQVGPPRETYLSPANAFVAGFMGSPPMNLVRGVVTESGTNLLLSGGNPDSNSANPQALLPLEGWRSDWFSRNRGRPVLLGVRPEHVRLSAAVAGLGGHPTLTGVVQSLQFVGHETLVRLAVGSQILAARAGADAPWQRGQQLAVAFDWSQARLYDAASGEGIL